VTVFSEEEKKILFSSSPSNTWSGWSWDEISFSDRARSTTKKRSLEWRTQKIRTRKGDFNWFCV